MKPDFSETYVRECRIFQLVNRIEDRGLRFDIRKAKRKNREIKKRISEIENESPINLNSPVQVLEHLQGFGISGSLLTNKGKLTTGRAVVERVLENLGKRKADKRVRHFIERLLEYRSLSKISGTYLTPLTERAETNDGVIYCEINPIDTITSRMASRNPNLLNVPEPKVRSTKRENPVRECFICREGFANYYFDYAQMEMFIFGILAGDTRITDGYAAGEDLHDYMAKIIWRGRYKDDPKFWRGVTKNINFGCIYGMGIKKMSLTYGMKYNEAQEYYRIYMKEFPSIKEFQEECRERLELDGCVWDDFGRRYCVPVGESYKAVNCLVQGSCAQIFKEGLLKVSDFIHKFSKSYKTHILLPVYDEVILETKVYSNKKHEKEFCKSIISCMVGISQLVERGLKLRVDVKRTMSSWANKKELRA